MAPIDMIMTQIAAPRRPRRLDTPPRIRSMKSRLPRNSTIFRRAFTTLALCCDTVTILLAALVSVTMFDRGRDPRSDLVLGLTVAALFIVPNLLTFRYRIAAYLSFENHVKPVLRMWSIAVGLALALAFLTDTTGALSRGAFALMYVSGLGFILAVRAGLVRLVRRRADCGRITERRIFIVGDEGLIEQFNARHDTGRLGLQMVGAAVLRQGHDHLDDDLALAVAAARVLRPDDIHIMLPWSDGARLDACINGFLRIPAAIHLAPEPFLERFDDLHVVRTGKIASLHLVRRPLSPGNVLAKRMIDIIGSLVTLLLLSPLFVMVALAIKLDSPGPVFFRQRRYGFNQEPFRIYKFRSMRTLEDDARLRQAKKNDPRVTRVGYWLRRSNIDELPQVLNVLLGEMSLVGPRPHALVHDQAFERDFALYARRHNVRPGITGWAQVNGWRGETDTLEKVQGRIAHDLYYIDHWSFMLDLKILLWTVFSNKAYENAH